MSEGETVVGVGGKGGDNMEVIGGDGGGEEGEEEGRGCGRKRGGRTDEFDVDRDGDLEGKEGGGGWRWPEIGGEGFFEWGREKDEGVVSGLWIETKLLREEGV